MDEKLVEKVAKAICCFDDCRFNHQDGCLYHAHMNAAITAIQATGVMEMREALEEHHKVALECGEVDEGHPLYKKTIKALSNE